MKNLLIHVPNVLSHSYMKNLGKLTKKVIREMAFQ
jgi:hypothetical protein